MLCIQNTSGRVFLMEILHWKVLAGTKFPTCDLQPQIFFDLQPYLESHFKTVFHSSVSSFKKSLQLLKKFPKSNPAVGPKGRVNQVMPPESPLIQRVWISQDWWDLQDQSELRPTFARRRERSTKASPFFFFSLPLKTTRPGWRLG